MNPQLPLFALDARRAHTDYKTRSKHRKTPSSGKRAYSYSQSLADNQDGLSDLARLSQDMLNSDLELRMTTLQTDRMSVVGEEPGSSEEDEHEGSPGSNAQSLKNENQSSPEPITQEKNHSEKGKKNKKSRKKRVTTRPVFDPVSEVEKIKKIMGAGFEDLGKKIAKSRLGLLKKPKRNVTRLSSTLYAGTRRNPFRKKKKPVLDVEAHRPWPNSDRKPPVPKFSQSAVKRMSVKEEMMKRLEEQQKEEEDRIRAGMKKKKPDLPKFEFLKRSNKNSRKSSILKVQGEDFAEKNSNTGPKPEKVPEKEAESSPVKKRPKKKKVLIIKKKDRKEVLSHREEKKNESEVPEKSEADISSQIEKLQKDENKVEVPEPESLKTEEPSKEQVTKTQGDEKHEEVFKEPKEEKVKEEEQAPVKEEKAREPEKPEPPKIPENIEIGEIDKFEQISEIKVEENECHDENYRLKTAPLSNKMSFMQPDDSRADQSITPIVGIYSLDLNSMLDFGNDEVRSEDFQSMKANLESALVVYREKEAIRKLEEEAEFNS